MNDDKELDLLKELEEEQDELEMPVAEEEPWVETEQSTLLDAFIYLTRDVDTTGRMHPQRKMTFAEFFIGDIIMRGIYFVEGSIKSTGSIQLPLRSSAKCR